MIANSPSLPMPGLPSSAVVCAHRCNHNVGIWLLCCCAVLLALIMLGGATRLTESGLSIVDWKPVSGVMPPLTEQAWQVEFARYQDSPQYLTVNHGMQLSEFKLIYWFEYGHRLLARTLGLVYAVPLLWFWVSRRIPEGYGPALFAVLCLGAAQGYLGWYMVQSGLVDIPRVSPYRLAAHLSLALTIFAAMWWLALGLLWPRPNHRQSLAWPAYALLWLTSLTIVYGAFVAGLRGGLYYNSFPLMGAHLVPPEWLALEPMWRNFSENPVTVQLVHRVLALSTLALTVALWWRTGRSQQATDQRLVRHCLLAAVSMQVLLGIATLLLRVPVWLGTLHQGGAVLLLAAVLLLLQRGRCALQSPSGRTSS